MYSIAFRPGMNLLDIAWHGPFTHEAVAAYAVDLGRRFGASGFRPGYLLRIDMTESAVQPQSALPMFRRCFTGFPVARRIAIVTPSAITRLQVRREMPQPYLELFESPEPALAWLLEERSN